jgi:hypothetical protein
MTSIAPLLGAGGFELLAPVSVRPVAGALALIGARSGDHDPRNRYRVTVTAAKPLGND